MHDDPWGVAADIMIYIMGSRTSAAVYMPSGSISSKISFNLTKR